MPHVIPDSLFYSWKFLLVESRTLGFGIRNSAQGIWEPVRGLRNPQRGIENPRLSWIIFGRH